MPAEDGEERRLTRTAIVGGNRDRYVEVAGTIKVTNRSAINLAGSRIGLCSLKIAVTHAQQYTNREVLCIGHYQVGKAIGVKISNGNGIRASTSGERRWRLKAYCTRTCEFDVPPTGSRLG